MSKDEILGLACLQALPILQMFARSEFFSDTCQFSLLSGGGFVCIVSFCSEFYSSHQNFLDVSR